MLKENGARCFKSRQKPQHHMATNRNNGIEATLLHLSRRPGEQTEVDWAGKTLTLSDSETGENSLPICLLESWHTINIHTQKLS